MSTWGGSVWAGSVWGGAPGAQAGSPCTVPVGTAILYPALRKAAVTLGPQRTPSPAQYQDALEELNRLIGSLDKDRLFIYSRTTYTFPLTGAKTYLIGLSSDPNLIVDFPVPRPEKIEQANIIIVPGNTRRQMFLATEQQWAQIVLQDIPNTIPEMLYDDYAYPVSTLYLWGQPMAGYQLELFVWQPVAQFVSKDDIVCMPSGYEDALTLNLAVRLAPHFQRAVDPQVRADARESLMRIMSLNAPQPVADTSALGSCHNRYNVYTDTWR